MLDIETMGNGSDAPILSIGACFFDEEKIGKSFYAKIDFDAALNLGKADSETIKWWLQQDEKARAEIISGEELPTTTLFAFANFAAGNQTTTPKDLKVWGNGAEFDNVILANLYKKLGIKLPWEWWNNRCYRTVKNMFKDVKADSFKGVGHKSIDDALHQAKHLQKIIKEKGVELR